MEQFSTVDLHEKNTTKSPPPPPAAPSSPPPAPELVSYPKLDPEDLAPLPMTYQPEAAVAEAGPAPAHKSVTWSSNLTQEVPLDLPEAPAAAATSMPGESNPYITPAPNPPSSSKMSMDKVKSLLGRWRKKVGEATRKTEDLAENTWQHLRTGHSFADAAMGRITQTTKVIAEGGYEKIFRQSFEVPPEEQLKKSFACYLSTSAGPIMGILYLSTAKLAFCSDNPLSYKNGEKTEWSYYKVVIPLHQLRTINPSASKDKPAEKYIQVVSVDNHEFWFLGFLHYDNAVKHLHEACSGQNQQPQANVPQ